MGGSAQEIVLFLRWRMFSKYFDTLLSLEVADEAGVPGFFVSHLSVVEKHNLLTRVRWQYPGPCSTASGHYSCSLLSLSTHRRGRNTLALLGQWPQVFVELARMLFNKDWGNIPSLANQRVFTTDDLRPYTRLASWRKSPSSGSKCLVENPPVLDFGEVQKSIYTEVSSSTRRFSNMSLRTHQV